MPAKIPTYLLPPSTYRFTEVSRRTFLSVATGAVASMLPPKTARDPLGSLVASGREKVDCILLDAQERCSLPESLAGYESALRADGVRFRKVCAGSLPYAKTIIIPACTTLGPESTWEVAAALKGGSCVVIESESGFATPADFAAHREWLRDGWSVKIEAPVDLWKDRNAQLRHPRTRRRLAIRNSLLAGRDPYVDLHWPLRLKVRDFSRVVPVSASPDHVVGWCGDWPIASKQTRGRGTLVFLGSPLGPALRAGDTEAHRWLREVIAGPRREGVRLAVPFSILAEGRDG